MTDDLVLEETPCGLAIVPPLVVVAGSMVYAALLGYLVGRAACHLYESWRP